MNGLSPMQLQMISYLFQAKEQQLNDTLGNLKPNDLTDSNFEQTLSRIKKSILLTPVTFEEPKILDHRSEERQMQGNYQNPFSHHRQVITATVQFPFEGSAELFEYMPDGFAFGGSSTRVYQPDYGNSITIDVEVDSLDKELVLSKARKQMDTTFSLIKQINPTAENWSKTKEPQIDSKLKTKKEELDNFYK